MRGILVATGYVPSMEPLIALRPTPLLNIVGKPILFHVFEILKGRGIKEIELILNYLPEQIEEQLDMGKRWGIDIHCHLIKDPLHPFGILPPLSKRWGNESILLGLADAIPHLPDLNNHKTLLYTNEKGVWTGWGIIKADDLALLPPDTTAETLPLHLKNPRTEPVSAFLSTRTPKELQASNLSLLTDKHSSLHFPTTAKRVEPGIWISRAVSIEPGADIMAPVFLGEETHIKSGAKIGPCAVIENNCLIDNDSVIEQSVICQNSYIGETLEIRDCIVDRNCLINLTLGTHLKIQEPFILSGSDSSESLGGLFSLLERGVALTLFLLVSPLYLTMRAMFKLNEQENLLLPAQTNEEEWKYFRLLSFDTQTSFLYRLSRLPWLISMIKGELHLIGSPPRTYSEVKQLPEEWKSLYLQSKAGIISLSDVECSEHPNRDELYAAEAIYAVNRGFYFDCQLFLRWIGKQLKGKK